MKTLIHAVLAATALCAAGVAHGAANKCQDENGRTVYSDIPCARKEAPPPPPKAQSKAEIKAKADASVTLARLSEADVLRVIGLTEDYTRTYDHAALCGLFAADMKYQLVDQTATPARKTAGGRDEACQVARTGAEQSRQAGLKTVIERGATKVDFNADATRATVVYQSTARITRFDRIISSYKCSSRDQIALYDGKPLFAGSDVTCTP
jgi:hypothetical protein